MRLLVPPNFLVEAQHTVSLPDFLLSFIPRCQASVNALGFAYHMKGANNISRKTQRNRLAIATVITRMWDEQSNLISPIMGFSKTCLSFEAC